MDQLFLFVVPFWKNYIFLFLCLLLLQLDMHLIDMSLTSSNYLYDTIYLYVLNSFRKSSKQIGFLLANDGKFCYQFPWKYLGVEYYVLRVCAAMKAESYILLRSLEKKFLPTYTLKWVFVLVFRLMHFMKYKVVRKWRFKNCQK